MSIKIHNHFDFYRRKVDSEEYEHVGHAENVVLNSMYNYISWLLCGSPGGSDGQGYPLNYIRIGTGTTTPSVTDTNLTNAQSFAINSRKYIGYNDTYGYDEVQFQYELQPTEAIGMNISEVGMAATSGTGTGFLKTRALITDNNGNPIAITKTSDEKLLIKATLYFYTTTYTVENTKPPIAWMPKWMEYWVGGSINWSMPLWYIICGFHSVQWNGYNTCYSWTYLNNAAFFKGLGQLGFPYQNLSAGSTYRRCDQLYKNVNFSTYGNQPGTMILNSNELNNADSNGTMDIYGICVNMGYDSGRSINLSSAPVDNVPISGLTLATADGIQDTFVIPHEDAKNITCSAGTFDVINKRISEVVPVVSLEAIGNYYNHIQSSTTQSYPSFQQSMLIPYLNGCAHFAFWDNGSKYLYGVYYYYDTTKQQYLAIPCRINIPSLNTSSNSFVEVYVLPDNSGLVIYNKNSTTGGNFVNAYIISYDASTGTCDKILYMSNNRFKLSQDMQYLFEIPYDTSYNKVRYLNVSTVIRTVDAITVTPYCQISLGNWYMNPYVMSNGTWYIKDNIIKICGGLTTNSYSTSRLFTFNATNKTLTQITHTGYAESNVSKNYAATFSGGILNVYSIVSDVSTLIYTFNYAGDNAVVNGATFKGIVEYNNRVYIYIAKDSNNGLNDILVILTQDTDGVWYDLNMLNRKCPTWGGDTVLQGAGIIYSEFTIGDYTIVFNAVEYVGTGAPTEGGSAQLIGHGRSNWVPCIRRKNKVALKFTTPPANGTAIVVSYNLNYLPKDSNWTLSSTPTMGFSRPS